MEPPPLPYLCEMEPPPLPYLCDMMRLEFVPSVLDQKVIEEKADEMKLSPVHDLCVLCSKRIMNGDWEEIYHTCGLFSNVMKHHQACPWNGEKCVCGRAHEVNIILNTPDDNACPDFE